jgi:hypothetical protein
VRHFESRESKTEPLSGVAGGAIHPVHAGAGNLLNEIGVDDKWTLLTGPSVAGLTDPIQLTAHSLVFLVRQLLYSGLDDDALQWILRIQALETPLGQDDRSAEPGSARATTRSRTCKAVNCLTAWRSPIRGGRTST